VQKQCGLGGGNHLASTNDNSRVIAFLRDDIHDRFRRQAVAVAHVGFCQTGKPDIVFGKHIVVIAFKIAMDHHWHQHIAIVKPIIGAEKNKLGHEIPSTNTARDEGAFPLFFLFCQSRT
jgi:hypothetical protein